MSTTTTALADVYARAGASDTDRPAWMKERATGITATQIRDLLVKGPAYRAELLAEKAQARIFLNAMTSTDTDEYAPGPRFIANQYTAWGNKREPVLAAAVQDRFAIAPESRVIHAAENARYLASPDGVGEDFAGELRVSELKTGKDNLVLGGPACTSKGYHLQMTWVMLVVGARRCMYAWEQHDSDWQDRGGQFYEPAPLEAVYEWYEFDEALAAELVKVADAFLADLDAMVADDYVAPEIDDELDTLAVNLLRFREEEGAGKKAKESTWAQMLERLDGCDALTQESQLARVTYTTGEPIETTEPDVEAAKAADPALFAEVEDLAKRWNAHQAKYMKTSAGTSKPHLTVTAVKAQKESTK